MFYRPHGLTKKQLQDNTSKIILHEEPFSGKKIRCGYRTTYSASRTPDFSTDKLRTGNETTLRQRSTSVTRVNMKETRYRQYRSRKLFTPDRRARLFISTALLITIIETRRTSGKQQIAVISESWTMRARHDIQWWQRWVHFHKCALLWKPSAAKRNRQQSLCQVSFTGELTSLATRTKTFQHLENGGEEFAHPLAYFDPQVEFILYAVLC